jgi:geranylgeranyl reductase family protein
VAGGGPIGSYAALALARLGHRVLVLERHHDVGHAVCCTGIVGKDCLDRFPEANNGVVAEVTSAKLFSPSGAELVLHKEEPQAYVVDRPLFDQALARRAQDEGAEYLLGAKVIDVSVTGDSVELAVEEDHGSAVFTGRSVVIASGFGTQLTAKVGLGRPGDSARGAQAQVAVTDTNAVHCYFSQSVAPGFFAWLVPTSPGRGLVGLLTRRSPKVYLERLLAGLVAEGRITSHNPRFTYGGVPLLPLRKTFARRVVVVGDAAGHCKPTTGGGIYYGLLGAREAAKVLDKALQSNELSSRHLSQYDISWRSLFGKELQVGYIARRMYENLSDKQVDRIFATVQRSGIHEALLRSPDSSFDWHAGSLLKILRQAIMPGASQ